MTEVIEPAPVPRRSYGAMRVALVLIAAIGALFGWANWPAAALPEGTVADEVRVEKGERRMSLLAGGRVLRVYPISLGSDPLGHKAREGDGRTPEGRYTLDYRKLDSAFHLAMHVSYPAAADVARAEAAGVSPGGFIMVHGLPNGFGFVGRLHRLVDWTDGCVAVTSAEIEEFLRVVPNGTPIRIEP